MAVEIRTLPLGSKVLVGSGEEATLIYKCPGWARIRLTRRKPGKVFEGFDRKKGEKKVLDFRGKGAKIERNIAPTAEVEVVELGPIGWEDK